MEGKDTLSWGGVEMRTLWLPPGLSGDNSMVFSTRGEGWDAG